MVPRAAILAFLAACLAPAPQNPYRDHDGDGFCEGPDGTCKDDALPGDCDDEDPLARPGAIEVCNQVDDNCVDGVDEGLTEAWYADADRDGFGDPAATEPVCIGDPAPPGLTADARDCDDADPSVGDCQELDLGTSVTFVHQLEGPGLTFGQAVAGTEGLLAISAPLYDQIDLYDPQDTTAPLASLVGGGSTSTGTTLAFTQASGADLLLVGSSSAGASAQGQVQLLDPLTQTLATADTWVGTRAGDRTGDALDAWPVRDATGWIVAIGAPNAGEDLQGGYGSVYLLDVADTTLGSDDLEDVATTRVLGRPQQRLGRSVAVVGDVDGDGANDAAIGSEDSGAAGEAYLVPWTAGSPAQLLAPDHAQLLYRAAEGQGNDIVVGRVGDVDGDGRDDVLVGHPDVGDQRGLIWLVLASDIVDPGPATPALVAEGTAPGDWLGASVFGTDVDGDEAPDLALGAPRARDDSGVLYVVRNGRATAGTVDLDDVASGDVLRLLGGADAEVGGRSAGIPTGTGSHLLLGAPLYQSVGAAFLVDTAWFQ